MDGVLVRQFRIMFVFLDSSRDVLILEAAARFELARKGFAVLLNSIVGQGSNENIQ